VKRLLWIGDAACSSGFGRASTSILALLKDEFEVTVLGINYRGDPRADRQPHPYAIYPAHTGGDGMGIRRVKELVPFLKPDLIVVQTNPWNIPKYLEELQKKTEYRGPVIGIVAVEGKNCEGALLNGLSLTVFWTEFAAQEAVAGGYTGMYCVIPLGVDLEFFTPGDKVHAHRIIGEEVSTDAFIVGTVNRNQNRKRLDLTLIYFAEWIKTRKIDDAYLYMHILPGSSTHVNCDQLAQYLKINERVILAQPKDIFHGAPDLLLRETYRRMDLHVSTSLCEGWGLTTLESMACGVPNMATDIAAIPEWAGDSVRLVKVISEGIMPDVRTMIGGVPSKEDFIAGLDEFYFHRQHRETMAARALAKAQEFDWPSVGAAYAEVIRCAM
jgi:glycosyltransferase involved in cell wall biosynthesis